MLSAIVTGANGFIGSAVCKSLLKHDIIVYAIVHKSSDNLPKDARLYIVQFDLIDIESLYNVLNGIRADIFFHFAWVGTSGKILANDVVQIHNITYTCDMLRLACSVGCKRFIFAGTINELELINLYNANKYLPRAACIYGAAKLAADFMAKTLARQLRIEYITAVIGSCYGPGDRSWRIHNTFIRHMLQNKAPKLISGEVMHDWVYIDDLAELFWSVGIFGHDLKSYYMGHRNLRKLKDILCEVRDVLCPNLNLTFGEIKDNFIIDYSILDLDAVYLDTGYECKYNFKDSIKLTAEWVKLLISIDFLNGDIYKQNCS